MTGVQTCALPIFVYDGAGVREIAVPLGRSPRDLVLVEWHDAIRGHAAALHDGRWGLANLELCIAALQSSRAATEVKLHEQVATAPADRG